MEQRLTALAFLIVMAGSPLVACSGGAPATACANDDGVCVTASGCEETDGTIAPSSPGGCDVGLVCCIPPAPKNCEEVGGTCTAVGECDGYYSTHEGGCDGLYELCCVPQEQCGPATIECCCGSWTALPLCDEGQLVCKYCQAVPAGTCLP